MPSHKRCSLSYETLDPIKHRPRWYFGLICLGIFCLTSALALTLVDRGKAHAAYNKMYQELALKGPNYRDVLSYYRHCQSGQQLRKSRPDCIGEARNWSKQLSLKVPFDVIARDIRDGEASVYLQRR